MKKILIVVLVLSLIFPLGMLGSSIAAAETGEDSYSAADWKPFNYVEANGFGSQLTLKDVRTNLSYENDSLTAWGRTTEGGMGVTFMPELDLENFSIEVSLNAWQELSPDRWFGFTFTDVAVKSDMHNEVPFYSKHSESWSNDYGAGTLFAWRPNGDGAMQIQFNYIGIVGTYDADGNLAENAGDYDDGYLGWTGWLSTIQLYNKDWTVKTDYNNILVTIEPITEEGETIGYAFDINEGYWKRTDTVVWDELAEDRFEQLDADEDGILSEEEKDNFLYGPAWETSIVPYANWGDSFNSLVQYQSKLAAAGKRLYMSFMYKDCWDIREGTPDASFTIHKINGKNATKGETTSLVADSTVTGKISATLTETNLHAGVYPSMVKSLKMVSVPENSYKNAADKISSKGTEVGLANTTVFSIKGAVESGTEVALISAVDITMDMSEFGEFELFKVSGTELDPVTYTESDGKITFRVPSTKSIYVLYHSATGGDGPNDSETGCGCGGALEAGLAITALFAAACAFILIGKRKSE